MKSRFALIGIGIYLSCALLSAYAFEDEGSERGGGDERVAEFMMIGKSVAKRLVEIKALSTALGLDPSVFEKTVNETKIESTAKTLDLNGVFKEAINFPSEKRIVFQRDPWEKKNLLEKTQLVLHEYLGVVRVDDSRYQVSSPLVDQIVGKKRELLMKFCRLNNSYKYFYTTIQGEGFHKPKACSAMGEIAAYTRIASDFLKRNQEAIAQELDASNLREVQSGFQRIDDEFNKTYIVMTATCGVGSVDHLPFSDGAPASESTFMERVKSSRSSLYSAAAYFGAPDLNKKCSSTDWFLE